MNTDFTDCAYPLVFVFAMLAPCFSTYPMKLKSVISDAINTIRTQRRKE